MTTELFSNNGEALFKLHGCVNCHDPLKDQIKRGLGPSILQIKEHYHGKMDELVRFLEGNEEPKVYPHRFELMKQQLEAIKNLTNEERQALARFLLK